MATITITISDDQLQHVLDLFAEAHGYQEFTELDPARPPVGNPETKIQFLRRSIVERIRRTVLEQEVLNASKTFRESQADPGIS